MGNWKAFVMKWLLALVLLLLFRLISLSARPPLLMLCLCGGLMLVGKLHQLHFRVQLRKWIPTTAVFIGYHSKNRGNTKLYAPIMEFETAEGNVITAEFPYYRESQQYTAGKHYHICYNFRKPEQFCIVGREDELERTEGGWEMFGLYLAVLYLILLLYHSK